MPPRFAFWTILIDGKATAFRAREKEELLPTFQQLKRTNKDVAFKWFVRGRLWESPEESRAALQAPKANEEKRGADWRPGGKHADPRARFARKKKTANRPRRETPAEPPHADRPHTSRPWTGKPRTGKPRTGAPRSDRPDRSWRDKTTAAGGRAFSSSGNRPWSKKPSGPPHGDRPWSKKRPEKPSQPPRQESVRELPPPSESTKIKPEPPERG